MVVVGRDARISGPWVRDVVCGTLNALGMDVVDVGLSTTPTVELAVPGLGADGGIMTASHNPKEWNALKFFGCQWRIFVGSGGGTGACARQGGRHLRERGAQTGTTTQDDQ